MTDEDLSYCQSIDSVISTLYAVISGDAGIQRDWSRLRNIIIENGRMIPLATKPDESGFEPRFLSVDDFIERFTKNVSDLGFHEIEIARRTEHFGNLANVFSTYVGKRNLSDEVPFMRGINSIQLINDGVRWWIVNILWQNERPGCEIPVKYLTSST